MNSKAIMVVFGILSVAMVGMSPITLAQETTTSTLTVDTTCGFAIGLAMDFETVSVGEISTEAELQIEGTGTAIGSSALLSVYAGDWLDVNGAKVSQINGERTKYATSDQGQGIDYASKTAMNNTAILIPYDDFSHIPIGSTNSTWWEVEVILLDDTFSGAVTQDLTFTSTGCT
jgi:hypothetical protein